MLVGYEHKGEQFNFYLSVTHLSFGCFFCMKDFIKCKKCGMLVNKNATDHGVIISYKPIKFKLCDGLKKKKYAQNNSIQNKTMV